MTMFPERLGAESDPIRYRWRPRDCSLYALAVGAGLDDTAYVTEGIDGAPQPVYPTFAFAVTTEAAAQWPDPTLAAGDFAKEQVVLGQQRLRIHHPLAPSGDVVVRARIAGIYDKGSGALLDIDQEACDAETGEALFTGTVGMFIIGEGGFGGEPEPETARVSLPDREPDARVSATTLPIQTLLYRHGGNDSNPLHVDPAFAERAGFPAPILTGQNTMGCAARALVHHVLGDPARVLSIQGRFAKPAFNGDTLVTEIWTGEEPDASTGEQRLLFRVVNQEGVVLVDRGLATHH
jgi:acyl dehydratase